MPFPESVKLEAKERAKFHCVACHQPWVEVHHIIPQAQGGTDTVDNAAPLCGSCHNRYGANADLRKQLREMRDHWWRLCAAAEDSPGYAQLSKRIDQIHAEYMTGQRNQSQVLAELKTLLMDHLQSAQGAIESATTVSEVLTQAGIAEQLKRARITGFSTAFHALQEIPWPKLFAESNRLDIVFAWGRTWRHFHDGELRQFVSGPDAALEVVLPHPESDAVINEMALRFDMTTAQVSDRIRETEAFFRRLGDEAQGTVRVYRFARAPLFSLYRFNNRAVFAMYRHRPGRGPVVTMLADRGGDLYDWLRDEWYGIVKQGSEIGTTSLVYDSKGNTA